MPQGSSGGAASPTIGFRVRQRHARMGPQLLIGNAKSQAAPTVVEPAALTGAVGSLGDAGQPADDQRLPAHATSWVPPNSHARVNKRPKVGNSHADFNQGNAKQLKGLQHCAASPSCSTHSTVTAALALITSPASAAKARATATAATTANVKAGASACVTGSKVQATERVQPSPSAADNSRQHHKQQVDHHAQQQSSCLHADEVQANRAGVSSQSHMLLMPSGAHAAAPAEAAKARAAAREAALLAKQNAPTARVAPAGVTAGSAMKKATAPPTANSDSSTPKGVYADVLMRHIAHKRATGSEPPHISAAKTGRAPPNSIDFPNSPHQRQQQCSAKQPCSLEQQLLLACLGGAHPYTVLGMHMTPTMATCFQAMVQQRLALLQSQPSSANCNEQLQQLLTCNIKTRFATQARDEFQQLLIQHTRHKLKRQDVTCADVLNTLPAELSCDHFLEVYTVDDDDPRVELRAAQGVRTKCSVPCGQLLGSFAGHLMCNAEREDLMSGYEHCPPGCILYHMHQQFAGLLPEQQVNLSQLGAVCTGIAQLHYIDQPLCERLLAALVKACNMSSTPHAKRPAAHEDGATPSDKVCQTHGLCMDSNMSAMAAGDHQCAGQQSCTPSSQVSAAVKDHMPEERMCEQDAAIIGSHAELANDLAAQQLLEHPSATSNTCQAESSQGEDTTIDMAADAYVASWKIAAGRARQVLWDMMCSQVMQLQAQLSQPLHAHHLQDPAILDACLAAHKACWVEMCDSYSLDVSFKMPSWMKAPSQVADDTQARLAQGWQLLDHINSVTISATPTHRNTTGYINDPAVHPPTSYLDPACTDYEAAQANCLLVELSVAGWPFPCCVATSAIACGEPISLSYGVHYWVGRAKRVKAVGDAVAHLELALRCHHLEQQLHKHVQEEKKPAQHLPPQQQEQDRQTMDLVRPPTAAVLHTEQHQVPQEEEQVVQDQHQAQRRHCPERPTDQPGQQPRKRPRELACLFY